MQSIVEHLGEDNLQKLINYALRYMSDLMLKRKRGNFIEVRTGLVNICPVGRSCTQKEREEFVRFDSEHKVRDKFLRSMERDLADLGLQFSIGESVFTFLFTHCKFVKVSHIDR